MRLLRRKPTVGPPHFCRRCMAINTGRHKALCPPCLTIVTMLGEHKREWQW